MEEYKNNNPDWKESDLAQIGRHFNADWVIYLEIESLSMFQRGSSGSLYRGEANLSYTLVDVNHPDESPEHAPVSYVYPSEARAMDVSPEMPPMKFRQMFLGHVAQRLALVLRPPPPQGHLQASIEPVPARGRPRGKDRRCLNRS